MANLRLDIVTAERLVFSGMVDSLTAPGAEGELGILPRHTPLLTTLQPGDIRFRVGEEEQDIAVSGGFMEVLPDHVVVLADTAERADEIDIARAEAALERARVLLRNRKDVDPTDLTRLAEAMRRSQVRLKVARRRRSQP